MNHPSHKLYSGFDKDLPPQILDRNGTIVLQMCKHCKRAEIELAEPCAVAFDSDHNDRMKHLEFAKVGDKFIADTRTGHYYPPTPEVVTVERLTPKQVVMSSGHKYRKDNADGIGGERYLRVPTIRRYTPERGAIIERDTLRRNRERNAKDFCKWSHLTDDELATVAGILHAVKIRLKKEPS